MTKPQNAVLGDNLTDAAQALAGDDTTFEIKAEKPKKAAPAKAAERKVKILLEDNEQVPPGGQFIQHNGRSFLIQPGHEVEVPIGVLDVLDHAVMSVPIVDGGQTVIGYRDRLRFPYRVITNTRGAY
jgi:hypothetical protein